MMRMKIIFPAILLGGLLALPDPASAAWSWGFNAGMGGHDFALKTHLQQPDPDNLFSMLAGDIPSNARTGLGGGLGLFGGAHFRHRIEGRAEAWWVSREARVAEDLGSGFERNTSFVREAAEAALFLRLGWPFKGGIRPYFEGGVFGNRTLKSRRDIGVSGGSQALSRPWEGLPNEDWGYSAGIGFDLLFSQAQPQLKEGAAKAGNGPFVLTPGIAVRYYEGQKDLDPKGPNELKSRGWMIVLSLGL
jgi:hypothetical protein